MAEKVVDFPARACHATTEYPERCIMVGRMCAAETSIADLKVNVGSLGDKLDRLTNWLMGATFTALLASIGWLAVLLRKP